MSIPISHLSGNITKQTKHRTLAILALIDSLHINKNESQQKCYFQCGLNSQPVDLNLMLSKLPYWAIWHVVIRRYNHLAFLTLIIYLESTEYYLKNLNILRLTRNDKLAQ